MSNIIAGFCIGFIVCLIMVNNYHKRVVDRGYLSVDDKMYEVKLKDK